MKKSRNISMILCIAAAAILSGFVNIAGGIALILNDYEKCGIALFISSLFLISGTVFAIFEKVWIPAVFNIIGTVPYIYTVSQLYAIPNTLIPKTATEPLAERHLLTVIVTVLLVMLTFFNFFTDKNVQKRQKRRDKKASERDRALKEEEKIL